MRNAHWVGIGSVLVVALAAIAPQSARANDRTPLTPLMGLSVASHLAAVGAEQSGTIVDMAARDGARVATGDVLFRLSCRLQQLEVDRLQALVDSDLELGRAAATMSYARDRAHRMRELSRQQISADSDLQEVELEAELARLALGKAELERAQRRNELLQAQESIAQRTLRSPLDGVVTRRFRQVGETTDRLEPVIEVMALDPLWVEFECPIALEAQFRLGTPVLVRPTVGDHQPRTAQVIHVSLRASVASHTFLVRAALANPDYTWRAGLKMQVEPLPTTTAAPPGK